MALTTTSTTPQTLLEAVNALLSTVRITGVMSLLAADLNEDAAEAKRMLDDACREVQKPGWNFNTEPDATIDPTDDGEISLPANTLKVRSIRCLAAPNLVQRGQRLYSPTKRTFKIGTSVTVDLVVCLPFDELPEGARAYVTALAARRFAPPRLPSGATFRYTEEVLMTAMVSMEQEDSESRPETLPETSPHFAAMARR